MAGALAADPLLLQSVRRLLPISIAVLYALFSIFGVGRGVLACGVK
jgi:hypothetical protein